MESSMKVPYKTKKRATIWSSNSTPGHIYLEEAKNAIWKGTGTLMFTEALFTIAKPGNNPFTYQEMIGLRCHTHTHTHTRILLSQKKRMKYDHLQKCGRIWRILCLVKCQRKINTVWNLLHVESKWHKWIYIQGRNRLTGIDNKLMVTARERSEEEG